MTQKYSMEGFNKDLSVARESLGTVKEAFQRLLITACFFAFKDGNTTPLNTILDMAVNSKSVSVERITRWVELHAGIARISKEQFVLNKKVREESAVIDEATFQKYEVLLEGMKWYDIKAKDKAKSAFDVDDYLGATIKTIERHMKDEGADVSYLQSAALELKAVRGKLAIKAIEAAK